MHPATKEIVETTHEQFQLNDFYLESYHFFQDEENRIHLSMTWLPNGIAKENDVNPSGAVEIVVDINTKKVKKVEFAGEKNMLPGDVFPQVDNMETVIEWIEEQTALEYGRQFKLVNETKEKITFHAAVDNIRLFPGGIIDISFNEEGRLTNFSLHGQFADESQIEWEPFNLVDEVVQPLAKQHCKVMEVPDELTASWKPYYVISSFLVPNQRPDSIIYFNEVENNLSYRALDHVLTWQEPSLEKFEGKDIDITSTVTEEDVFHDQTIQDHHQPISDDTLNSIVTEITEMLRMAFPNDSGQWRLSSIKRERGYLFAKLNPVKTGTKIIYPSLNLWIHPKTLQVENYTDATSLLEAFDFFEEAETVQADSETAAELLSKQIEVEPVYVYHRQQNLYQLCGKVTSGGYAVDAVTGELSTLDY
ncbi:hypothetical protein [Oceanobacillus timonensis]|uniref:hypothetical protein n=1 Tax=Oceanobacillus timonensis TaxID=1926285 RepID=UPI0009B98AB5|nr:hypothetical protein [Oceanobacillus timonensis]